jgi:TolA-binding protein
MVGAASTAALGAAEPDEECYRQGLRSAAQGSADEAIAWFDKLIAQFPASRRAPEAMLKLGESYRDKKLYYLAVQQFNAVVDRCPEHSARAQLGVATCYSAQKKYLQAITLLQQAISALPDQDVREQMDYLLAQCYRGRKDWDTAIPMYQKLEAEHPEDAAQLRYGLGLCYLEKTDYEKATRTFEDVAGAFPNTPTANEALLKVAECLWEQAKSAEDLAYLNKLYDEHPDLRARVLHRRAEVLTYCFSRHQEAQSDLRRILTEYPADPIAVRARALTCDIVLNGLKDVPRGKALLREFFASYPNYERTIVLRGRLADCAYAEGNYLEAARLFEDAYLYPEVSNWRPCFLFMIVDCYNRAGDAPKAAAARGKLLMLYADDPWAQLLAGMHSESSGQ